MVGEMSGGMMFMLGKAGSALPPEGTAWLVMPDGATYQIESLKQGISSIPTEQVETGETIDGRKVVEVRPTGEVRIVFHGTGVRRGRVDLSMLETIKDERIGPTRMIDLE